MRARGSKLVGLLFVLTTIAHAKTCDFESLADAHTVIREYSQEKEVFLPVEERAATAYESTQKARGSGSGSTKQSGGLISDSDLRRKRYIHQLKARDYTFERMLGDGGQADVLLARRPDGQLAVIKIPKHLDRKSNLLSAQESEFLYELSATRVPQTFSDHKGVLVLGDGDSIAVETRFIPRSTETPDAHDRLVLNYFPQAETLSEAPSVYHRMKAHHFGPDSNPAAQSVIEGRIRNTLDQVAEVLAVAHAKGIVHRDICTQNILLDDQGNATVIDWGLAARIKGSTPEASGFPLPQMAGNVSGHVEYASKNQLQGKPAAVLDDLEGLRKTAARMRLMGLGDAGEAYVFTRDFRLEDGNPPKNRNYAQIKDFKFAIERDTDTEAQKQVAAAEFSRLPQSIQEWQELQKKARTQSPATFAPWYGKKILSTYQNDDYQTAALEVLSSRFAIGRFDTGKGKLFQKKSDLENIAKAAYELYEASHGLDGGPVRPGLLGTNPHVHFRQFFEKLRALKKNNKLSSQIFEETAGEYFRQHEQSQENAA